MDLVAFLTARLDEDEAKAKRAALERWPEDINHPAVVSPLRQIREADAKRRILAMHQTGMTMPWLDNPLESVAGATLRVLAIVYADHPDYDTAWA